MVHSCQSLQSTVQKYFQSYTVLLGCWNARSFLGGYLRFRKITWEGSPAAQLLQCPFLKWHMRNRSNVTFTTLLLISLSAAWCCFTVNLSAKGLLQLLSRALECHSKCDVNVLYVNISFKFLIILYTVLHVVQ